MQAIAVMLVLAAFGAGIVYGAVRLGWLETDDPPAVSLPVLLPTETPQSAELSPTETPNPATPTLLIPTPTLLPTFTLSPPPILVAIPTATITTAVPTEQEIVVSAFAECRGQYSGADRQSRLWATNQSIKNGFHTVESVRKLVDEHCGGMSPELVAAVSTERPTVTISPVPPEPTPMPQPSPTPTLLPKPTTTMVVSARFNATEMEAAIHQRINEYREEHGHNGIRWDNRLAHIARTHSEDMAKNDYYSHINHAGDNATSRARKAGYNCDNPRSIGLAENIHLLYGHTSTLLGRPHDLLTQEQMIQMFVADWTNSPGHRRIILDPRINKTGIGVAFGTAMGVENGIYVTQKFC